MDKLKSETSDAREKQREAEELSEFIENKMRRTSKEHEERIKDMEKALDA